VTARDVAHTKPQGQATKKKNVREAPSRPLIAFRQDFLFTDLMIATRSAILFLVSNRPYTTARVFKKIREARPPRLYIAADGPRPAKPPETEICQQT
jgi:hypothetical protein